MSINENKELKLVQIAKDVLYLSRNILLVNMRFLDMALSQLPYVKANTTICTDGKYLYYDPLFILNSYKNEKESVTRGYLHIIMHCIYRHMFVNTLVDSVLWDLACDIAVEASIMGVEVSSIITNLSDKRQRAIDKLKREVNYITAEKLYDYFLNNNLSKNEIDRLIELFSFDDHTIWYKNEKEKLKMLGIQGKSQKSAGTGDGESYTESGKDDGKAKCGSDSNTDGSDSESNANQNEYESGSIKDISNIEQEKFWKDVSEHIQQDLESFSKMRGDSASDMVQNLKEVNREKYDYTSFLKKFAVMGEAMKINDDEFDYVFYTYGLNRYGNMPLIEPLEYKDEKRIREFVIAIDTSGSVSGELVQTFLNKTYNILMSTESFFSKINIHIIQCDADIQEDKKITKKEEFEEYIKTMKLRGFGGTDFRPVFSYVDRLIENHEFINLKGLIYFTDGYGSFPAEMPDYKTAFIFLDEGYDLPEIPSWAIRLVLQKRDI